MNRSKHKVKVISKAVMALLSIAMPLALSSCGGGLNQPTGAAAPVASAPARFSPEEARALYYRWLETHTELSDYTLSDETGAYKWKGEEYYLFHAAEISRYWYNILVHKETGAMLFMMTSDGEEPVTTVEPLDDWYKREYAP